ncbi:hypothetical protein DVA81_18765, partial [Acinetobacter baumannii]
DHAGLVIFNILSIFQAIGGAKSLNITDPIFGDRVKVFYASYYLKYGQMMSRCHGVPIAMTTRTMGTLIECENEGEQIYFDDWPINYDR